MLRRCLTAISKLTRSDDAELSIIIVDNEAEPNNRDTVAGFPATVYVHEGRRGIVNARNAVIEAAIALNPDLIAMTDDDCVPSERWLCEMLEAQRHHDGDVVRGHVVYRYPDPLPRRILPPKKSKSFGKPRPGKPPHVGTNNVLFSSQLVREDGLGLRFDPRLNLTGGEDTDFFTRAWERGAHIVDCEAAVVFEDVPADRCTYWRLVKLQYQYAAGNTIMDLDRGRYGAVALGAMGRS